MGKVTFELATKESIETDFPSGIVVFSYRKWPPPATGEAKGDEPETKDPEASPGSDVQRASTDEPDS